MGYQKEGSTPWSKELREDGGMRKILFWGVGAQTNVEMRMLLLDQAPDHFFFLGTEKASFFGIDFLGTDTVSSLAGGDSFFAFFAGLWLCFFS